MDLVSKFQRIGLSEQKAKETATNKKLAANLSLAGDDVDKGAGTLLYTLASTGIGCKHLQYITSAITDHRLLSADQVSAAIKFCQGMPDNPEKAGFDAACGVNVVVTIEEIEQVVSNVLNECSADLESKRYQMLGLLLGKLKNHLRWANQMTVKQVLDKKMLEILGPKDERDDPKTKKKKEKLIKTEAKQNITEISVVELAKSNKFIFEGELSKMHKAGENPQLRSEIMQAHLARTNGKVITRFPPEPNGFLHIGHAKAINVNFGFANAHNGITNLRYDDTNPEAEEQIYFDSIKDMVQWLGYEPNNITYSSDSFQRLYDLAVDLTKRDKAYICHCSGDDIHKQRGGEEKGARFNCPHRDRPVEESLREFERMRKGEYKAGEAILRMKMDMQHPNPQFWDLIAYRVMFIDHIRTGSKWCIYPTYDYTHCLCDSFEDITHSFCTTEFTMSRESYYWLVDALEQYKPVQWESGRLTIAHTVLSKRKLNTLVTKGIVNGWDDPRLYTLASLRRRGFTPQSINAFVREMGVTMANTTILPSRLEHYVRDHLNQIAPRLYLLLEPLKVNILNLPDNYEEKIAISNKPKDDSMGQRTVVFSKTIYIDASDFRDDDDPNYFRLAPGKTVGLLNVPWPIRAVKAIRDESGKLVQIDAEYLIDSETRPKTYIHWVGMSPLHKSPVSVEVRLVSELFLHANPASKEDVPGGWLTDINPDSMKIVQNAMLDTGILNLKIGDNFQGVRLGYFCVDPDTDFDAGRIVINRTVTLKEDAKKDK